MMIGPEPMIRIFLMSFRLGMGLFQNPSILALRSAVAGKLQGLSQFFIAAIWSNFKTYELRPESAPAEDNGIDRWLKRGGKLPALVCLKYRYRVLGIGPAFIDPPHASHRSPCKDGKECI